MRLSKDKIETAMVSAQESEPLVAALRQVLNEMIADETLAAINSNLSAEARAYNCGRVAGINDFKELLMDLGLKLEPTENY